MAIKFTPSNLNVIVDNSKRDDYFIELLKRAIDGLDRIETHLGIITDEDLKEFKEETI